MEASGAPRRFDPAVVANRALVLAQLGAFIAGVYVAIVVGAGAALGARLPNTGLSIVATVAVAVSFRRVKERARRIANRVTYGERATPYQVLAAFSEQVSGAYAQEDLLEGIARVVAEGTGAELAIVWLRVGGDLAPAASWPPAARFSERRMPADEFGLPALVDVSYSLEVVHDSEALGAISVRKASAEELTEAEARLVQDVASQAGFVLRNVRLTAELALRLEELSRVAAELRASRRRIVAAQDAERRRLERDIHDGAQQHLVALAVKVRMANQLAAKDPKRARTLIREVRALGDESLATLRDLTRGIYPPVLARRGIASALRAHLKATGVRATVSDRGGARYAPEVEAAVYFSCLEAIQNAAKHAGASRIAVGFTRRRDHVEFQVSDDGAGFDQRAPAPGSGLLNLADRVAAAGGSIFITSAPDEGTIVSGRIDSNALGKKP